MNEQPWATTALGNRVQIRLLRAAAVKTAGATMTLAAGAVASVEPAEAERLVKAGDATRTGGGGIVVKAAAIVRCELPATLAVVKAAGAARRFRAIASTATPDRSGDIVEPAGWQLAAYRKNPVVLFAHLYDSLPIARATRVAVEGRALVIEAEFPPVGASAKADEVAALIEAGLLAAVSVGFRPIRFEPRRDGTGLRYLEQELLEVSVVPVPANPDAMIEAPLTERRSHAGDRAPAPPATPLLDARVAKPDPAAVPGLAARQGELKALRRDCPSRGELVQAELRALRRSVAPERAGKVAEAARLQGRPRLSAAAAVLSRIVR